MTAGSTSPDSVSAASLLNAPQAQAVQHRDGPLLVLAGPGSGKTRVITQRIARLIETGVPAWEIVAITFTNKAAKEMDRRVQTLLPGARVWVSTFHRFCARLLRQYGSAVGLAPNFTILDSSDQQALIKQVLHELDIDPSHYPPARMGHRISQAKNKLLTPELFKQDVESLRSSFQDQVTARVYEAYQKGLLAANGVDFDDLLLHVCVLLQENPEIRAELDARYRYILVDEYQDTNLAQYQIVRLLSLDYPNLCATGDPDQSIYGWRGAEIGNILRFERDFPDCKVIRLEQNYRSTQEILTAADQLIGHNTQRKHKALFSENDLGERPQLLCFYDEREEADGIARLIDDLATREGRSWSDFAILYRVNALSRNIELGLTRAGIPYQVAAGVAFYERTEVKDVLCYLRLIHNPAERAAFLRVINTPTRGLGKTSLDRLLAWSAQQGTTPLEAARRANQIGTLSKKAVVSFQAFAKLIDELAQAAIAGVEPLLRQILDRTGYTAALQNSRDEEDLQRLANVQELMTAAREYDEAHPEDPSLEGFLENASLVSDIDSLDEEAGRVTLMTLHAAKGLEFPVAIIVAVEHNLLPHERAIRDGDLREFEEERRLLFVGMTRAEERLYLTKTELRTFRGMRMSAIPSQFLSEMRLGQQSGDRVVSGDIFDGPSDLIGGFDDSSFPSHSGRAVRSEEHEEFEPSSARGDADESGEFSDDALDFQPFALEQPTPDADPVRSDQSAPSTPLTAGSRLRDSRPTNDVASSEDTPSPVPPVLKLMTGAQLLQQKRSDPDTDDTGSPAGRGKGRARKTHRLVDQSGTTPASSSPLTELLRRTAPAIQEPSAESELFPIGQRVRHPRLGAGTVKLSQGSGKWRTVTVEFANGEQHSFVVEKCVLQPIG